MKNDEDEKVVPFDPTRDPAAEDDDPYYKRWAIIYETRGPEAAQKWMNRHAIQAHQWEWNAALKKKKASVPRGTSQTDN
jgi:hypothetical protein